MNHSLAARDDIHESIMEEGHWPPSPGVGQSWHVELDIASFVNTLPGWEQDEVIGALWRGGDIAYAMRERYSDRIKAWIPAGVVEKESARLEEIAAEDGATDADWERLYGKDAEQTIAPHVCRPDPRLAEEIYGHRDEEVAL